MRSGVMRFSPSLAATLQKPVASAERTNETSIAKGAVIKLPKAPKLSTCRRGLVVWQEGRPKSALLIKKRQSQEASRALRTIAEWLQKRKIEVMVEALVAENEFPNLKAFDPDTSDIDIGITLGGDGTVLHLASLFERDQPMPPVVSFAMGTVGFLTPFDVPRFDYHLLRILKNSESDVECTLRTRKKLEVINPSGKIQRVHHVLNECIIDRGASQSTITVEIVVDGTRVANVQADGLIMATPSGSTAYSMTAGGPMVAPSVPCTIITPLAPLSLSFRPLVIPETSEVVIHVLPESKSIARASFDGKKQARLTRMSSLRLTSSTYPLPLINIGKFDADWYEGITQKLKWNQSIGPS